MNLVFRALSGQSNLFPIINGGVLMVDVQGLRHMNRHLKLLTSAILAALVFCLSDCPHSRRLLKTINASATLAYNLKGLNHNVAVQRAYIADKYLYVTRGRRKLLSFKIAH